MSKIHTVCVRGSPNGTIGNICTFGTNGITILPFAPISLPMIPLVIELAQMVKMLPINGTIGETRTHALLEKEMKISVQFKLFIKY